MASTDFPTGAYRDTQEGKLDYEGFLSPFALRAYARYMHDNRRRPDGDMRDSDNWQLGIPFSSYVKSLLRHVMDVWVWHRGGTPNESVREALCGVVFNAMGILHELEKENEKTDKDEETRESMGTRKYVGEPPADEIWALYAGSPTPEKGE